MSKLLNLHCHSNYSDGANSIEELAVAYKNMRHTSLILTDHDYLLTSERWEAEVVEAASVSKKLNFPIIVGLEAYVKPYGEEILIFGQEACRSWFSWKVIHEHKSSSFILDWFKIQKERESYHPFALVLAHPYLLRGTTKFYEILDGYEVSNLGIYWGDFYVNKMQELMPKAKPYHGIDLHSLNDMSCRCNEIDDEDLIVEEDLIAYLKR